VQSGYIESDKNWQSRLQLCEDKWDEVSVAAENWESPELAVGRIIENKWQYSEKVINPLPGYD
jgi:hypothetical protein